MTSTDVNEYLRRRFTAKDFRTWAGTVLAARALRGAEPARNGSHRSELAPEEAAFMSLVGRPRGTRTEQNDGHAGFRRR